ncbi:hypothetical protein PS673_02058 [Pseudomonas fluorescens]|jgi:hypothetical protein|uniref:Uncharacterized protein n=1 Tax=Pseudomonas fluorescens TaxID=294 RepID=A0A5E6S7J0_PSEFL|nr:hypothetical protein [Pseudomonas fluorescens]VVM76659.1 hypothetical protein PS673_02058 [Pseudomonas fluorescens]
MFASGDISRKFALEIRNFIKMKEQGVIQKVVKGELHKILEDRYDAFYTNSRSIEIYDGETSSIELRLLRKDSASRELHSHSNELMLFPISGEIEMAEYRIKTDGVEFTQNRLLQPEPNFIAKSSISGKCYRLYSTSIVSVAIVAISKIEPDDICVQYDIDKLSQICTGSTNITESRIEFWMRFYPQLKTVLNDGELEKMASQAVSRKFQGYLMGELKNEKN